MKDMEEQLRDALRRCDPPEGFAERVVGRLAENRQPVVHAPRWTLRWPSLRWAVAAAIAIFITIGIGYRMYEQRQEAVEAMVAKRQVMLALRITGAKLRIAKQRVKAVESGQEKTEKTL